MPQRQSPRQTAKIAEWKHNKVYGYLQLGERRVFFALGVVRSDVRACDFLDMTGGGE
jgi:hypothetical protein